MLKILTITLNPAIDLSTSVEAVVAGPKLYCKPPRIDPGGGGVNVARTIQKLGGQATALLAVAGARGDQILELLTVEDVPVIPVRVHGETRQSLAVTDESSGAQYRFSLPGETLTAAEAERLLAAIANAASKGCHVVLSGGVPPGLGDDFPAKIQRVIAPFTDQLIVDTSKAPLAWLMANPIAPLLLLRVDQKEAAQAAHHAMETIEDSLAFASALVAQGVAKMVVTGRGAEGSVMVTERARYHCKAPRVPVRSKVGAGDAFVGAMTMALARGEPAEQALVWGVAASSATVCTEGTALCDPDRTRELRQACDLRAV